jgi:lipid A oxidase
MRARFLGTSVLLWINLLTFLPLFAEHGSCAEFVVSLFSGVTSAENNDLRLTLSGGTDLTFRDVSYKTHDWESPIYYGGRVAYFRANDAHWGVSLEFFHAKMYLNTEDTVRVTGTRASAPVNAPERVGDTITDFNISHGLNFLTANAMYRWFLADREQNFLGRFQPYLGAGIGAAIPHVESTIGAVHFEQYQFRGPACQAMAGLNFDLAKHLGLFAEYKFTYADLDRLSIPNGSISLTPLTQHLATGISVRF